MKRVWRISSQLLENHKKFFTEDYEENKKLLLEVSEINSKKLRNQIAGHITKTVRQTNKENK